MNNFNTLYREILKCNKLDKYISDEYTSKFELITDELIRVNSQMNLTAITDISGIIARHYADSLLVADYIPLNANVIDVGCGAGFPTLPLAVVRSDLKFTALDSTSKKLGFISDTSKKLGLNNITVKSGRAEVLGKDINYREKFDAVCARAVAPLNILSEYCLPFAKVYGKFFALKGAAAFDEIESAESAIVKLGGKISEIVNTELVTHEDFQKRVIIIIDKTSLTNKIYPRNNSQITKNQL